ncbi:MAG: VWA domain-containing protein, partial [Bacteroidota bacterium]
MKQMMTIKQFGYLICLGAFLLSAPIFGQSNFINIDTISDKQKLIVKITPVTKVVEDGTFSIRVAVQDSITGKFITGLAGKSSKKSLLTIARPKVEELCPNFDITELTEEMEIADPLNIAVVLDYSGSMSHYVDDLKSKAEIFIKHLKGNLFTRINFDDDLSRRPIDSIPTKTPKSVLDDNYRDYGGGTALYAAIRDGIETLSQSKGDRALVVFTDGYENASGIGMQTVWQKAKDHNVSVYAIGFDVGGYAILDSLCRYTGGKFYPSSGIDSSIFKELGDRFSNHYILKGKCKKSFDYPVVIK